ncbi:MAG TPA: metal-dependent hydrolase [Desulfobacteraceae bacterium]|nr:metal-dependent hydrolase [Desulfobacteraceae bacterium]
MNNRGFFTLFAKEVWRFLKVWVQTILAPVVTVFLYLLVFASVLSDNIEVYKGVGYSEFLIPGLIMMAVLQNAFANSSSSLFQAKQNGSIIFILLSPVSSMEFYLAYVLASIVRGICVGIGVWIVTWIFTILSVYNLMMITGFAVLGSGILGSLGLIASIWADKWDHISAFQNFVILPLSFLSGVFFSIESLPPFWSKVSYFNPFFYLIDGFRFGFLGTSEISPYFSLMIGSIFFLFVSALCIGMLKSGYKLRD